MNTNVVGTNWIEFGKLKRYTIWISEDGSRYAATVASFISSDVIGQGSLTMLYLNHGIPRSSPIIAKVN
jgi:hypothetical protein